MGVHLDITEEKIIKFLSIEGFTASEISMKRGVAKSTITRILRQKKEKNTFERKNGSGCTSKFSNSEK